MTGLGSGGGRFQLMSLNDHGHFNFYAQKDHEGAVVDSLDCGNVLTGTKCNRLNGNPVSLKYLGG